MIADKKIGIPVEECFKQFGQSFNRVKYFSCISNNLQLSDLPEEWEIENPDGIKYAVNKPDDLGYILEGYKNFIQRYLVRDCIESFSLCLDQLFFSLMLDGKKVRFKETLMDVLSQQEKDDFTKFQDAGLFSKIEKLENKFDLFLTKENKKVITSLKDIRNCFAHSNGHVRKTDGSKHGKGERVFRWKTFHFFLQGVDSGKTRPIVFNESLSEASNLCLEIMEYARSYKIGEFMSFSPKETFEIAYSLELVGFNYLQIIKDKLEGMRSCN